MIRMSGLVAATVLFLAGCGGAERSTSDPGSAGTRSDDAGRVTNSPTKPESGPPPATLSAAQTGRAQPEEAPSESSCIPGLLREAEKDRDWPEPDFDEQQLLSDIMRCELDGFSKYVGKSEAPDFRASIGYRPLHLVIWQCDDARILLDGGADPNLPYDGLYPIEIAVRYRKLEILKQLLDAGAEVAHRNDWCQPLLHSLVENIHRVSGRFHTIRDVLSQLIAAGLDLNTKTADGKGILHLMLEQHAPLDWFLPSLLEGGLDIDQQNQEGDTPLMLAAALGRYDDAEMLLKAGASVACTNREGITALMLASAHQEWGDLDCGPEETCSMRLPEAPGQEALVRALLKAGADPKREDSAGRTALDHAREAGNGSIVRLLTTPPR